MLKSGNIYKLGDGPINYNWNLRYFVLDGIFNLKETLIYHFSYRNESRINLLLK